MGPYRLKTVLTYSSFLLLGLIIVVYSIFQAKYLIIGPQIKVTSPTNGFSLASSTVEITGRTSNISSLSLNGRTIFTDEEGNFKEKLLLPKGYTIIELSATDKFGRNTKKHIELTHY